MSGFVAVVNTDGAPVDRDLLGRLTGAMAFRGPDAQRTWVDGSVGLGHTLLATVDDYPELPQPCSIDGRVWLAGDVRVDGRADLVAKLADHTRAPLATASDPELVLHAYHAWGEHCVNHLIGDFAFAVWDGDRQRLFCARDHMGVKPLYYARTRRALVVSNTLDAARLHPSVSDELNEQTIGDFLLVGHLVDPATTGFADVHRVPAAHTLTWDSGRVRTLRYWTLQIEPPVRYAHEADYVERVSELLRMATSDRLRANRLAIHMSGGLDSASVAAVARALRPCADFRAYTTVYDHLIRDDERHYAGTVARHIGIPIRYRAADEFQLFYAADEQRFLAPGPILHPLWSYQAEEYAHIAHRSRVVLTGHGGDAALLPWPGELLGYVMRLRIVAASRAVRRSIRATGRVPRVGLRTAIAHTIKRRRTSVPSVPTWLAPDFARRIDIGRRARARATVTAPEHPYRRTAYASLTDPFWDFLLEEYDAGLTRQTLEFRHPLLDVRVLRYLLSVPTLPYCVEKHLLRAAMHGALPDEVRLRPKAPLQSDPVLAMLRCGRVGCFSTIRAKSEIARFVQLDRVWSAERLAAATPSAWTHLRPYGLDQWLTGARLSRRATRGSATPPSLV